jgi:GNAT superfamily N-acetyltransferase
LEEKTAGVIVETSKRGDVLEISKIETPKGSRGQGLAQSKLDEIIAQADRDGVTLALTPSNAFGASKKRLTDWYRRNGFVPNKGQNKNFATRESMVRPPTVPVGNRGLLD